MNSELHDRLEYLVNFSSQLIFVSGDSIAQQQRTLESFVYQQHDDTEIAYLTAQASLDISDYRRQLCRQLLGQVVGSFVRPLNELLAELNQHDGPILITITQAQYIPDKLLQELWDLVLQSRFAGNKQHLNVLLFGETVWAENAKQWLPAKNTDTPLLIGSQSVHLEEQGSDLDQLISKRRAAFHEHMANKYDQQYPSAPNRLKSGWFWAGIIAIFLSLFVAILGWQYGTTLSTIFNPIESQPVEPVQVADEPLPNATSQQLSDLIEQRVGRSNGEPQSEQRKAENGPDALVSNWTTEKEKLVQSELAQATIEKKESALANPIAPNLNEIGDTTPDDVLAQIPQVSQTPDDKPISDLGVDNATLLATLKSGQFYLQMAGLKNKDLLADFLNDYALGDTTYVYRTQRYGGDWFVVIHRNAFSSFNDARDAVPTLKDFPGKSQVFAKGAEAIINEIQQDSER